MTTTTVIYQDPTVTVNLLTNGDTIPAGQAGHWEQIQTVYAAGTTEANAATIEANIKTHLAQIETWLAANPNGAVLTAAQTAFLARMLVGVGRILLGLVDTVGQAT